MEIYAGICRLLLDRFVWGSICHIFFQSYRPKMMQSSCHVTVPADFLTAHRSYRLKSVRFLIWESPCLLSCNQQITDTHCSEQKLLICIHTVSTARAAVITYIISTFLRGKTIDRQVYINPQKGRQFWSRCDIAKHHDREYPKKSLFGMLLQYSFSLISKFMLPCRNNNLVMNEYE